MDINKNLHQINFEDALIVPGISQNLTSHKPFVETGHLVFFHKLMSGIVLNCSKLDFIKETDTVIPFDRNANGMEYLSEYTPAFVSYGNGGRSFRTIKQS